MNQVRQEQKNPASFALGKYLISPLARMSAPGIYHASVSIRSGHGRASHDRVFRFLPQFSSLESACSYAAEQGRAWVVSPAR